MPKTEGGLFHLRNSAGLELKYCQIHVWKLFNYFSYLTKTIGIVSITDVLGSTISVTVTLATVWERKETCETEVTLPSSYTRLTAVKSFIRVCIKII